jgi:hypothetical protein
MSKAEQKTAGAILQKSKQVLVGGATYEVAPPSAATLILVSELAATLPKVENNNAGVVAETLRIAKDCKVLGEIVATLILGAKKINYIGTFERDLPWSLLKRTYKHQFSIKDFQWLVNHLLEDLTPKELSELAVDLLEGMETGFFLGLTTSLKGINLTKPTRVAVS